MEGKLIKTEDGYNLVTEQPQGRLLEATCSPSQEKKLFKSGATAKKLSLKNCEAIANGYDLDELVKSKYPNVDNEDFEYDCEHDMIRDNYRSRGFYEGAKAIIEILGDKKFSEKDVRDAYYHGEQDSYMKGGLTKQKEDEYIQSLQQTEFDVEIEMNIIPELLKGSYPEEKLDENGCLILKRKV